MSYFSVQQLIEKVYQMGQDKKTEKKRIHDPDSNDSLDNDEEDDFVSAKTKAAGKKCKKK